MDKEMVVVVVGGGVGSSLTDEPHCGRSGGKRLRISK